MQLREDSRRILGKAVQAYLQALEINPNDASAYKNLGDLLVEQGNLEEAIQAYRQALELDPNDAVAYRNRGNAKWSLNAGNGDKNGYCSDWKKAVSLGDTGLEKFITIWCELRK